MIAICDPTDRSSPADQNEGKAYRNNPHHGNLTDNIHRVAHCKNAGDIIENTIINAMKIRKIIYCLKPLDTFTFHISSYNIPDAIART